MRATKSRKASSSRSAKSGSGGRSLGLAEPPGSGAASTSMARSLNSSPDRFIKSVSTLPSKSVSGGRGGGTRARPAVLRAARECSRTRASRSRRS